METSGKISFRYIPSAGDFYDGAYRIPPEVYDKSPLGLGMFHQHATQFDSRWAASPSGSPFRHGGDMSVAAIAGVDGVLVTSLEKGKFAVHFYNERGDVVFVGVYSYPVSGGGKP